jgi:hypothetical protein
MEYKSEDDEPIEYEPKDAELRIDWTEARRKSAKKKASRRKIQKKSKRKNRGK